MRLNPSRRALVGGGTAAIATLTATNGTSAAADVPGSQLHDRHGRCHAASPPTPRWRDTWRATTAPIWSASGIRRLPETTRTRTNGPSPGARQALDLAAVDSRYAAEVTAGEGAGALLERRRRHDRLPGYDSYPRAPTAPAATCSTTTTNGWAWRKSNSTCKPGTRRHWPGQGDLRPRQVGLGHRLHARRSGGVFVDPGELGRGPQHRLEHAGRPARPPSAPDHR